MRKGLIKLTLTDEVGNSVSDTTPNTMTDGDKPKAPRKPKPKPGPDGKPKNKKKKKKSKKDKKALKGLIKELIKELQNFNG